MRSLLCTLPLSLAVIPLAEHPPDCFRLLYSSFIACMRPQGLVVLKYRPSHRAFKLPTISEAEVNDEDAPPQVAVIRRRARNYNLVGLVESDALDLHSNLSN